MTPQAKNVTPPAAGRPGLWQLAKIALSCLAMIGRKGTWEGAGDGARMTRGQLIGMAVIAGLVIVATLIGIVRIALLAAGAAN